MLNCVRHVSEMACFRFYLNSFILASMVNNETTLMWISFVIKFCEYVYWHSKPIIRVWILPIKSGILFKVLKIFTIVIYFMGKKSVAEHKMKNWLQSKLHNLNDFILNTLDGICIIYIFWNLICSLLCGM